MAATRQKTIHKRKKPKRPDLIPAVYEEQLYKLVRAIHRAVWARLKPIYQQKILAQFQPVLKLAEGDVDLNAVQDMPEVGLFIARIEVQIEQSARTAQADIGLLPGDDWAVVDESTFDQVRQHEIELCRETIADMVDATQRGYDILAGELKDDILAGNKAGESLAGMTNRLAKFFNEESRWKARRIAHTESARTHNYGVLLGTEKADFVAGYEWVLSVDACDVCKRVGLDAKGRPVQVKKGQPFATFTTGNPAYARVLAPPLHPNCVLGDTPIVASGLLSAVSAQYQGRLVTLKTADGSKFTVTPNHMILTTSGWARAQDLRKGDDIIRTSLVEVGAAAPSGSNPDNNNRPALAKEIFDSLRMSAGVTTATMPVSAEDLHGDGAGCQGEIDIVFADSFLPGEPDAAIVQEASKSVFQRAGMGDDSFTGGGSLEKLFVASLDATNGVVGRSREIAAISWGESRHSDPVGFRAGADSDAHLCEPSHDNRTADAKVFRHLQDAVPGIVCATKVVDIEIFTVHEPIPVYDFQTTGTQYIIGNGIISSNCRCTVLTVMTFEETRFGPTTVLAGKVAGEMPDAPETDKPKVDIYADVEPAKTVKPARPTKPAKVKPAVEKKPTPESLRDEVQEAFQAFKDSRGGSHYWVDMSAPPGQDDLDHALAQYKPLGDAKIKAINKYAEKLLPKNYQEVVNNPDLLANYDRVSRSIALDRNGNIMYKPNGSVYKVFELVEKSAKEREKMLAKIRSDVFKILEVRPEDRVEWEDTSDHYSPMQSRKVTAVVKKRAAAVMENITKALGQGLSVGRKFRTGFVHDRQMEPGALAYCSPSGYIGTRAETGTGTIAHEVGHAMSFNYQEVRTGKMVRSRFEQPSVTRHLAAVMKDVDQDTMKAVRPVSDSADFGSSSGRNRFSMNEYSQKIYGGGADTNGLTEVPSVLMEFFYDNPVEFVKHMPEKLTRSVLAFLDGSMR